MRKKFFSALMVLALWLASVPGATWHVGTHGSDDSTGADSTKAFLTIGAAISALTDNDSILIYDGTYTPSSTLLITGDSNTTLVAYGSACYVQPPAAASQQPVLEIREPFTNVIGITFQFTPWDAVWMTQPGNRGNLIQGCSFLSIGTQVGEPPNMARPILSSAIACTLRSNTFLQSGRTAYIGSAADSCTITQNKFRSSDLEIFSNRNTVTRNNFRSCGLLLSGSANTITNNIIYHQSTVSDKYTIHISGVAASNTIINNTIFGLPINGPKFSTTGTNYFYNNIYWVENEGDELLWGGTTHANNIAIASRFSQEDLDMVCAPKTAGALWQFFPAQPPTWYDTPTNAKPTTTAWPIGKGWAHLIRVTATGALAGTGVGDTLATTPSVDYAGTSRPASTTHDVGAYDQ